MSEVFRRSAYATHATLATVTFAPVSKAMPILTAYHATGDASGSLVKVYTYDGILQTTVDATSNASQAVLNVASTTSFAQNDLVALVHESTRVVEFRTVTSVQAGVSLTMTANLTQAFAAGDKVYRLTQVASFPCGIATVTNYGGADGILGAGMGYPLVVTLNGTSANTLHTVSVKYDDGKTS